MVSGLGSNVLGLRELKVLCFFDTTFLPPLPGLGLGGSWGLGLRGQVYELKGLGKGTKAISDLPQFCSSAENTVNDVTTAYIMSCWT